MYHAARGDEKVKEDVLLALERQPDFDASGIRVEVESGVVRLSGTVENFHEKRVAESAVFPVPGVRDVSNALKLREGLTRPIKDIEPASKRGLLGTEPPAASQQENPRDSSAI